MNWLNCNKVVALQLINQPKQAVQRIRCTKTQSQLVDWKLWLENLNQKKVIEK